MTLGEESQDIIKDFSHALDISRVSFASKYLFEKMLGAKIGAATIYSALLDHENKIQIVIDKAVVADEFYVCSDGTTTCYMKVKTSDIVDKFLPYTQHQAIIAEV
ncbi:MAG TPA: YbaK/EbsC family protein [Tetragenococcus sp.]|nr:YbaK/EbsC family protein [Tetragenococcus sp.]